MQVSYRTNHSTEHDVVSLTENIKSVFDGNSFGCGIFVDLKEALVTVNHSSFFKKDGALQLKRCSSSMVCLISLKSS